jgi:hypothetical protein
MKGGLMRRNPARPVKNSVWTTDFARRASTAAHSCAAALFQAVVWSALMIGCVTYPSAHADTIYGTGSYTVPGQLPYGIYIAHADPSANPAVPAACTFSTWTSDGKLISADSGTQMDSVTARIQAPAIAKFITHGCTPWTKVG